MQRDGNETFSLSAEAVGIDVDEDDTRQASRARALAITAATCGSSPAQNDAGMPIRRPVSDAGEKIGGSPVMTASSSATSPTVRPIGPTVSRVWLIGTTPAPS